MGKFQSFRDNYLTYKNYDGQFQPSEEELQKHKVATHHAPFENAAIDNAEFDKAVKSLGRRQWFLFYNHFLIGQPVGELAWFSLMPIEELKLQLKIANNKVLSYLLKL